MVGSLLGNRVVRVEDPQMLVGRARYVDDLVLPGALHLAFVRSTRAHARLLAVDAAAAAALPGVVGVFTADDLDLPDMHVLVAVHETRPRASWRTSYGPARMGSGRPAITTRSSMGRASTSAAALPSRVRSGVK